MALTKTETIPWDPTEHLDGPVAELGYPAAAMEDGDPGVIAAAIGDIARARGATDTARLSGVSRETLYKTFAQNGNPTLSSGLSVLKLDIRLKPEPIEDGTNSIRMP